MRATRRLDAPAMRRLGPWILVIMCASACLPRERFNKSCDWIGDPTFVLDPQNARDEQHLIQDAQLAEELMVRYADFKHKEPFGYEGHGGLLQHGKVAQDCLAKLDAIIEANHGVTPDQIVEARTRRDWRFDAVVLLSFAMIYALASTWSTRWLATRFLENGHIVLVAATVLCSLVASIAGIQLLDLWATTAEMLRLGNDHLGPHRGELIPWSHHSGELFAAGVLIFVVAARRMNSNTTSRR